MTIKIPKKRMLFVCSSLAIVLLSLIFYIVVMAVGFGLPGARDGVYGNFGFWHCAADTTTINGSGICCIVFAILITGLLVADYFLVKKHNIFINKYLKRGALSIYLLFILALILAFAGKPTSNGPTWYDWTTKDSSYSTAGSIIVAILCILLIVPCTYAVLTIIKYRKNKKRQKAAVHKEH